MAGITVTSNLYQEIPYGWPWATGRYYGPYLANGALGTGGFSNSTGIIPFLIPQPITLASVNVEVVTTAATAGTLARMAIYYADDSGYPDVLLADWGTVLVDATGLRTISISTVIKKPGLYWIAICQPSAAANANYRMISTASVAWFERSNLQNLAGVSTTGIQIGTAAFATAGYPTRIWRMGDNSAAVNQLSAGFPRVLLGV